MFALPRALGEHVRQHAKWRVSDILDMNVPSGRPLNHPLPTGARTQSLSSVGTRLRDAERDQESIGKAWAKNLQPIQTEKPDKAARYPALNAPSLKREFRELPRSTMYLTPSWKRVLDIAAIIVSTPIWLTAMVVISLWIKLVSRGPVFFRQERVGRNERGFMMLKFRSMKVHAETERHEDHFDRLVESDRPMTKLDAAGDQRMIFSGRLLRATGLDELPQIFNVLAGDMSLVGPRPCTVRELAKFQPWQRERFDACPGLTGHWQVNGKNKTTFSKMIELDIYYVRHMRLWLDLKILLKTIPALFAQVRGS